jgi:hypothetical protein
VQTAIVLVCVNVYFVNAGGLAVQAIADVGAEGESTICALNYHHLEAQKAQLKPIALGKIENLGTTEPGQHAETAL